MPKKQCKDCGDLKDESEFRKWSRQCKACYIAYGRKRYRDVVHPHTKKAQREARPVTEKRVASKKDYAAIMRARLGFEVKGCVVEMQGEIVYECPLLVVCSHPVEWQAENTLLCEVSNADLGILEVVGGMPESQTNGEEFTLWADNVMTIELNGKGWLDNMMSPPAGWVHGAQYPGWRDEQPGTD